MRLPKDLGWLLYQLLYSVRRTRTGATGDASDIERMDADAAAETTISSIRVLQQLVP